MFTQERYDKILKELHRHERVTVTDLSEAFGVSTETVRRDLLFLEKNGFLKRVFGGAVPAKSHRFETLNVRISRQDPEKKQLALLAAKFVEENDTVALDCGSTALALAAELKRKFQRITVVTYHLGVFQLLKDKFPVILIGGEYFPSEDCFCGEIALQMMRDIHVSKSFFFPSALSVGNGIEDFIPNLLPLQHRLIDMSDRVFACADSSKFGARALIRICDINRPSLILTDDKIDDDLYADFLERGLPLVKYSGDNHETPEK